MEILIQNIRADGLVAVYGQERTSAILKYIQGFLPYAPNFQPIVGSVIAQRVAGLGGQSLLTLTCPLLVQCRDAQNTVLVVKVIFPIQFPDRAPFAVLTLPSNAQYKADHTVVLAHGVIRLANLPLLQEGSLPPYSLCDILLAITDALGNEYPFVLGNAPNPPASHSVGPPGNSPLIPSPLGLPTPLGMMPGPAVVAPHQSLHPTTTTPTTTRPPSPPPPPPTRPLVLAAAEALMLYLGNHDVEDYITVQLEAAGALARLQADRQSLQTELESLTAQKARVQQLQHSSQDLCEVVSHLQANASESELTAKITEPQELLATSDDASTAALQLLTDIHAYDDAMMLEEQMLRRGIVQAEDYIKVISDQARSQFRSRYRFGRLLAAVGSSSGAVAPPPAVGALQVPLPKPDQDTPAPPSPSLNAAASTTRPSPPLAAPTETKEPSENEAIQLLTIEFQGVLDPSIVGDVWAATQSMSTARSELRSIAGLS
ncbi:ESCRT-I subunit Vps23, putative [Bodo saltans]|uniref:ESCRT-I subunit Vps23, putative n=1 Tax=Bodo saltans TaxID=75058 RepID=A0A0S4KPG1_BODSA|nr:ESCRT-I subunit Vps23, putative [Bodo saltans]|eukprot:CUI15525.1 ESCRT-I subunit Vps23, putative [Bodo saltans]